MTAVKEEKNVKAENVPWHKRPEEWGRIGSKNYYCKKCLILYPRATSLSYHLDKAKRCKTDQRCAEQHDHRYISKRFDSPADLKKYLSDNEYDTMFVIRASSKENVYYECNRKARPDQNNIRKSRKTEVDCPARFIVKTYQVVRENVLKKPSQIKKSEEIGKTVHLLIGCLTHSHDINDTKMLRLSQRVRKNIVLLLRLGIAESAIRHKYMATGAFGGSAGKELTWDFLNLLQRKNHPVPPDLNFTEREGLFRYSYFKATGALNFVTSDPLSYNPRHAYSKSNEMVKTKTARIVNTPMFIMTFMDEHQQDLFRKFPKTVIAICTKDIYKDANYNLISLLVLEESGEATPFMQCVSANEVKVTAAIMIETLKIHEPEAGEKIKILISDQACCTSFIDSVASILQPKVLITLDVHESQVRKYSNVLRTMIANSGERLDQLIYSLFKANDLLRNQRLRRSLGLARGTRSHFQHVFVSFHPLELQNDLEISELPENGYLVKYQSEECCVSRTTVGFICDPEKCQVKCPHCPKDSLCGHSFVCSCATFQMRNGCSHIHNVFMHLDNEEKKSNKFEGLKNQALEKLKKLTSKIQGMEESEESLESLKNILDFVENPGKQEKVGGIVGYNKLRKELVEQSSSSEIGSWPWFNMVVGDREQMMDVLIRDVGIDEREAVLEKYIQARELWTCKSCGKHDDAEKAFSGYIECSICFNFHHIRCCKNLAGQDLSLLSDPGGEAIMGYVCDRCGSFAVIQPAEPPEAALPPDTKMEIELDPVLQVGNPVEILNPHHVIVKQDLDDAPEAQGGAVVVEGEAAEHVPREILEFKLM